jgi:hypothetical protein
VAIVMTQSESQVGSYLTLVPSSTHMPQRIHHGWPDTISYNIHKEVSSNSATHEATKFMGPHESYMRQYITQCLFIRTQPTRALIDSSGGYHLGAPNFRSDHSPSFPSSILHFPLIAPPNLQLYQHLDHLAKST